MVRLPRWRGVVAFLCITVSVLFLVEAGFRALLWHRLAPLVRRPADEGRGLPAGVQPAPQPLGYEPRPGGRYDADTLPLPPDFPRDKPPGKTRVLVLGDSITAAQGIPWEQGSVALTEAALRGGGSDVRAINTPRSEH